MDISKWSGVGISHNFVRFKKEAAQVRDEVDGCLACIARLSAA